MGLRVWTVAKAESVFSLFVTKAAERRGSFATQNGQGYWREQRDCVGKQCGNYGGWKQRGGPTLLNVRMAPYAANGGD